MHKPRKLTTNYNLEVIKPTIAKEWHPRKNGKLTPRDITPGSGRKVWWLCSKRHEWEVSVSHRTRGNKCPFCGGKRVNNDNCLWTINRKLAKEWHPSKNGKLLSRDVTPGSNKKVWWRCNKGHEWTATVNNRNSGFGCPYCSHQKLSRDNSLLKVNPRLSAEWHPRLNGNLTPEDVFPNTHKKVWWLCARGHEWMASVDSRTAGRRCPYCNSQTSTLELRIFSELLTIFNEVKHRGKIYGYECDIYLPFLKLAIEIDGAYWHKGKEVYDRRKSEFLRKKKILLIRIREQGLNKIFRSDISFKYNEKDVQILSRLLKMIISKRKVHSSEIKKLRKYLSERKITNDKYFLNLLERLPDPSPGASLAENYRVLARQWHPVRNGTLKPESVTVSSNRSVWWICQKGHEWQEIVSNRSKKGYGCPFCSGQRVGLDNCLKTINPRLAAEWHPIKNGSLTPLDVTSNSNRIAWWMCREKHEWQSVVCGRNKGLGCPYCSGQRVCRDNCLRTRNKRISKEWHPTKNGSLTPEDVTTGSNKKVWWVCKRKHEWQASVNQRSRGAGCPYCSHNRVSNQNSLQFANQALAREWHPTKNRDLHPEMVAIFSNKRAWWRCKNGHEWEAIIANRSKGKDCPYCRGNRGNRDVVR